MDASRLGPDPALLAKKRQEKEAARNRHRRRGGQFSNEQRNTTMGHNSNSTSSKLSREDRLAAIRDMQQDAGARTDRLAKVAVEPSANTKLLDEEQQSRKAQGNGFQKNGNFLTEMQRKVNGIDL